jgi:hypothetical protein
MNITNGVVRYGNGEYKAFMQFINGDIRVDGWISEWRRDFEEKMRQEKAKPVIKLVPVYKPVKVKSRTVYQKLEKAPCPLCSKKMNKGTLGLCRGCGRKWAAFINQESVRVCKRCPKTLQGSAIRGLCSQHSELERKRDWKRRRTAMLRLAVAA